MADAFFAGVAADFSTLAIGMESAGLFVEAGSQPISAAMPAAQITIRAIAAIHTGSCEDLPATVSMIRKMAPARAVLDGRAGAGAA